MRCTAVFYVLIYCIILNVFETIVLGQSTCNNGNGRILYERLPNQQLQGFDDDVVRDTGPPFRVLEKCQDLCLRDRTVSNSMARSCSSFDFQPGSRVVSYTGSTEYEESTCYLTREQPSPEGIGILMQVPNSVHFTEVCMRSSRPERECPSRRYVFERHPRKKLKLAVSDLKEVAVSNRSDCEDKCLNEYSFICRSANYNSVTKSCTLSRFTRRTHPGLLEDDPNSDYLENTCLNAERRCDGIAIFVKELNKGLSGPFEVDIFNNMTLEECQMMCIRAEKYFCRSVEYDEKTKQCSLSEEDSVSQKDDIINHSSPTHNFYDLICLDNLRGQEYMENTGTASLHTSHLFTGGLKTETAFQRFRNSRLASEFHSEITGRSLSECLDECLRQTSFQCRSSVYSERFRTCRLSRFNQLDGMRIIYDADYDYFENLMLNGMSSYDDKGMPNSNTVGDRDGYIDRQKMGNGYRPYKPAGDRDRDYDRDRDRDPNRDRDQNRDRDPNRDRNRDRDMFLNRPPPSLYDKKYYQNSYPERYPMSERYPMGERFPMGERYPMAERYPDIYRYSDHWAKQYPSRDNQLYRPQYLYRPASKTSGFSLNFPFLRDRDLERTIYLNTRNYAYDNNPRRPYQPTRYKMNYRSPMILKPENSIKTGSTRCDNEYLYRRVGSKQRIRPQYVRQSLQVTSLQQCQQECNSRRDFACRGFNYMDESFVHKFGKFNDYKNCELSERDTRDLDAQNPAMFEYGNFDFYERNNLRSALENEVECLDVEQSCSEDSMEFTLHTPEGFYGRIYTFGHYDRCFFRGSGGTVNILRISGSQGHPPCGSQRFGEALTNIVVVQFADNVQTGRDKRFNLTCLFRHPGEAVVTSSFIGAGSGSPMPIEYLPAENNLSSKVRLMIIYQNRPTTTIAVGDPLTLRIESQDGYNAVGDLFAYNVVARDPYSGRSIQLIDKFGCAVDPFVFPELDISRSGDSLEARFNAFKIPESNFLVFEATVKTCREGCQPIYCQKGQQDKSYGRRKRESDVIEPKNETEVDSTTDSKVIDSSEQIREIIEVFESRDEIESVGYSSIVSGEDTLCLSKYEYNSIVFAVVFLIVLLCIVTLAAGYCYRQYWISSVKSSPLICSTPMYTTTAVYDTTDLSYDKLGLKKNVTPGMSLRFGGHSPKLMDNSFLSRQFKKLKKGGRFDPELESPNEPIYLDTSMFENSRNSRSED